MWLPIKRKKGKEIDRESEYCNEQNAKLCEYTLGEGILIIGRSLQCTLGDILYIIKYIYYVSESIEESN